MNKARGSNNRYFLENEVIVMSLTVLSYINVEIIRVS
jgi:hypothetical protein